MKSITFSEGFKKEITAMARQCLANVGPHPYTTCDNDCTESYLTYEVEFYDEETLQLCTLSRRYRIAACGPATN